MLRLFVLNYTGCSLGNVMYTCRGGSRTLYIKNYFNRHALKYMASDSKRTKGTV